jgi:hypothetical protein
MKAFLHGLIGGCLACTSCAFDFGAASDITAVSGRTSKDYVRTRLANGSFASEPYAFAQGGAWKGAMKDFSFDKMTFLDVAHIIARPLADQNYIPSKDPKATKLLIMVYWGTTHAPEHASDTAEYQNFQISEAALANAYASSPPPPQTYTNPALLRPHNLYLESQFDGYVAAAAAENRRRDQDDERNAMMLGYDSWWDATNGDNRGTALEIERKDLLNELEDNRYFVVLMAYDFQLLWKGRKHKLLWETRFSIRQQHHEFDKDLPAMAQFASQYFGQESNGLVHKAIPLGHVEIGDVRSLGEVSDKSNADTTQPPAKP